MANLVFGIQTKRGPTFTDVETVAERIHCKPSSAHRLIPTEKTWDYNVAHAYVIDFVIIVHKNLHMVLYCKNYHMYSVCVWRHKVWIAYTQNDHENIFSRRMLHIEKWVDINTCHSIKTARINTNYAFTAMDNARTCACCSMWETKAAYNQTQNNSMQIRHPSANQQRKRDKLILQLRGIQVHSVNWIHTTAVQ